MYPEFLPPYKETTCPLLQLEVQKLYREENLMVPPLSEKMPALRRISPVAFATQSLPETSTVYDVNTLLNAVISGEIAAPFAAFGLGGHGFMSQAVHYHFATPQVVVLLQMRWGTIIDDPEDARTRYNIYMGWCQRLERESYIAMVRGTFPEDRRLVVLQSELIGKSWAWLPNGYDVETDTELDWQQGTLHPIFDAAQQVRRMIQ